jgi:hypothetical protein
MTRRYLLLSAVPLAALRGQDKERARGRLIQESGLAPALLVSSGTTIQLAGDEASLAVLRDSRLKDADFEVVGQATAPNRFAVDPIHERALFVYRGGKRLVVTYWCEICSIRTYSPGQCVCCQEDTQLDLRDPALKDSDPSTA